MTTTVREARADDVPAICRIAEQAWRAAYGEFLEASTIDAAMAEWYDPDVIQERLDAESVGFFVADRDGEVLGFANGNPAEEDGVAFLGALYVDPDYWREGLGAALLGAFESFCRERGFQSVRFGVLEANDVGRSFYRQYGYEQVDDHDSDLFGQPITEVVYRRDLH